MADHDQVHRAISDDGTEIDGQIKGQGDSKTTWRFILPFLSEHFTCYPLVPGRFIYPHGNNGCGWSAC